MRLRLSILAVAVVLVAGPAIAGTAVHALASVCLHASTGHFDATKQAANTIPRDVVVGTTHAVGVSAAHFGDARQFRSLRVDVGQPGVDGTLAWTYWTGDSYRPLAVVNGAFDAAGHTLLRFEPPLDWTPLQVNAACAGSFFYLRSTTKDGYTIPPVLDRVLVES